MRAFAAAAFALLLASAARADDTAAPVIEHKPVTSAERGAKFVQVFARIVWRYTKSESPGACGNRSRYQASRVSYILPYVVKTSSSSST